MNDARKYSKYSDFYPKLYAPPVTSTSSVTGQTHQPVTNPYATVTNPYATVTSPYAAVTEPVEVTSAVRSALMPVKRGSYQAPASENSVCKMYVGMPLAADEYLCSGSLWQCSLKKRGCHSK